jgi:hypothetical protein
MEDTSPDENDFAKRVALFRDCSGREILHTRDCITEISERIQGRLFDD